MAHTPLSRQAKLWAAVALGRAGSRRQLLRSYLYDMVGHEADAVGRTNGGLWVFSPTGDHIGREAFVRGDHDRQLLAKAVGTIEKHGGRPIKGRTFVDVGANIGLTTMAALSTFGAGAVVAIEPSEENLRFLRVNLAANGMEDDVRVIGAALSGKTGALVMEFSDTNCGDHRLRDGAHPTGRFGEHRRATVPVEALTFDDLDLDLVDVGMVWMDVQGHEAQVLAGATSLLQSDVPVVTEYWPYGLRRASGLDDFHRLVGQHYREVIDLRTGRALAGAQVAQLERRYGGVRFTDLVLLP